nr:DUF3108 domain-containing protein [Swingsia samuiensis]
MFKPWIKPLAAASLLTGFLSAPPAFADNPQVNASYAVYVHGWHALNVNALYTLDDKGYTGQLHVRPAGVVSWFVSTNMDSQAEGRFAFSDSISPISYESRSLSHDKNYHVKLIYTSQTPQITILDPKDEDREEINSASLVNSVDVLGGMARLLHTVQRMNSCNGSALIFDGQRLTKMSVHGPKIDQIPQDHGEAYSGSAIRCDFVGQQIAGFIKNSPNRSKMASPQPGSIWLVKLDNQRIVPVRVEFDHPKLGHITVVIKQPVQN